MAQGGAEPMLGEGVVAGAASETPRPLSVLRGQWKLACDVEVPPTRTTYGVEVAQRAKPTKIVHVGAVLGIPETLPAAGAADCPQSIHP